MIVISDELVHTSTLKTLVTKIILKGFDCTDMTLCFGVDMSLVTERHDLKQPIPFFTTSNSHLGCVKHSWD